ncbi:hypothetical protein KVR01_011575 [Diaporthe batatas]|uniref:uncharacterized protein n=1 Tax=Diaporthe batatas TaxID=748121 RepID=UPI001D05A42D|nr:uncharacterized protein KVR01_011575 [Diaporthe batatas]KAG8158453.1 hypothetical protein KVR01_011575 [Diaporthe batatas]
MISSGYLPILGLAINAARAWPSQSFKTESFTPPVFNVTKSGAALAPGLIFLTPSVVNESSHGVIITDDGELVWSIQEQALADLSPQTFDNQPVLVYWDGAGGPLNGGTGYGQVQILDSTYTQLYKLCPNFGLVGATNDCQIDVHEAYITERDSIVVTAYNATPADLSSLGGPADGWVLDSLFYEIDIKTQEILFSWSSLSAGIPVNATKQSAEGSSQAHPLDYFHINSVHPVETGYLINSRNCWAMFMLDSEGEIQWELESWEHNARVHNLTSTGLVITFFDNHNGGPSAISPSSGQVLSVDLTSMSVTLLERLLDPNESLYSGSQGSNQVLSNGNFLVGYGAIPEAKEYGPDGDLRMKIVFGDSSSSGSYRAFRVPWTGIPSAEPKLVAGNGTAYMSWNGATSVTEWAIYEGLTADALELTGLVKKTSFETSTTISDSTKFVQVSPFEGSTWLSNSSVVAVE